MVIFWRNGAVVASGVSCWIWYTVFANKGFLNAQFD